MQAPDFWRCDGFLPRLLSPLAALYTWGGRKKRLSGEGFRAAMPVVCVGNIVAGGAGKTPVCLALGAKLAAMGRNPHFLTRGYGGTEAGPRLVDPVRHNAARVGDEALLLATQGPTWVSRHRPDGAVAAAEMGAGTLVMDDGFQNGSLIHDLALVVVDGGYGFGNGRVIPAGPCREPVADGLARAQAVVLMGDDHVGLRRYLAGTLVLQAHLVPGAEAAQLQGAKVAAFAGIGRPGKFFDTLRQCGAQVVVEKSFPDHHAYGKSEIVEILDQGLEVWTTAKDAVRVPPELRDRIRVLNVTLAWDDEAALDELLAGLAWR